MRTIAPYLVAAVVAVFLSLEARPSNAQLGRAAPDIEADSWINGKALHRADLLGRVILVEFWTFACSNCRNVEPYVKRWHRQYADRGLVVIGIHSPESDRERDPAAVANYVREHDIRYPVAIDKDFKAWESFANRAWPAFYLVDRRGFIRYTHVGEGNYEETERQIQTLLLEPKDAQAQPGASSGPSSTTNRGR